MPNPKTFYEGNGRQNIMTEMSNQTPEGKEPKVQTPEGTTGEGEIPENKTPIEGEGLPPEVDYKKKFSDSAREVQRLLQEDKLKEQRMADLEAKLAQASATPSQMSDKYPDWDMMTETEKMLLQKQETQEKELATLKAEREWNNNLSKVKKTFPELANHEEEFSQFCQKYPNADIEVMAKSFLFDKTPFEEPKPRKGLEKPSGGSKTPDSEHKWTSEEVARLRETDEKKYLEMVKKGLIKGKDIK